MSSVYPVDLQLHSTCSDGTDSPEALVAMAAQRGMKVIALTDHDSVLGVDDAMTAGAQLDVRVLPAIEFSTLNASEQDFYDINILGYGIGHDDPDLLSTLQRVIDARIDQKVRQTERLQSYGVDVPVDEVMAEAGGVPGRVHIAKVALRRNPKQFTSVNDVFTQYLAGGAPNSTFVPRAYSLTVEDAIELSHQAGGIAVLAHPGIYTRMRDVDDVVRRLCDVGLDGLEVRYTYAQNRGNYGASHHAVRQIIEHFDALADELDLHKTGGSDYHGATKPGIEPGQAGMTQQEWHSLCTRLDW